MPSAGLLVMDKDKFRRRFVLLPSGRICAHILEYKKVSVFLRSSVADPDPGSGAFLPPRDPG
jgi:hypothetical protein